MKKIFLIVAGCVSCIIAASQTYHQSQFYSTPLLINPAFTGNTGGAMKALSDYLINVPSKNTPRIQECHIMLGHIICQLVEEQYFS